MLTELDGGGGRAAAGADAPWDARARELEARQGPWSGYAAWEEWFGRQCDDGLESGGYTRVLDDLDGVQLAHIYNLFCRLAAREPGLWPAPTEAPRAH